MGAPFDPISTARRLANAHPDTMLPCPHCAASVKAPRLLAHIDKVHDGEGPPSTSWRGSDRSIFLPLGVFGGATLVGCVAVLLTMPAWENVVIPVFIITLFVMLALAMLALLNKLPATLHLDTDRVEVRTFFGLVRRSVSLVEATVDVGGLLDRRNTQLAGSTRVNPTYEDVKVGTYLRLSDGRATITLGSKKGTGLRKHWDPSGWTASGQRRGWHATVDRVALVTIEYALANHGRLAPRATEANDGG